ncbi:MAG TPA: hypothetical protein ENJ52_02365 [Aliiroseovarius sp.]|nr:hypothetical protein [Aliiroseovarius sp.]
MEKRLYLHIGPHKTGTSAFQASLRANRMALRRRGVHVVSAPAQSFRQWLRPPTNLKRLAHLMIRSELKTIWRMKGAAPHLTREEADAELARAARRLARVKSPRMILSGEAFFFLREAEEKARVSRFLEVVGRPVTVLCVNRDEADWRRSWEYELHRDPAIPQGLAGLAEDERPDGEWYFDRDAVRAFWRDLPGVSVDFREIDYAQAMERDGTIVSSLYQAMGLDTRRLKTRVFRNVSK